LREILAGDARSCRHRAPTVRRRYGRPMSRDHTFRRRSDLRQPERVDLLTNAPRARHAALPVPDVGGALERRSTVLTPDQSLNLIIGPSRVCAPLARTPFKDLKPPTDGPQRSSLFASWVTDVRAGRSQREPGSADVSAVTGRHVRRVSSGTAPCRRVRLHRVCSVWRLIARTRPRPRLGMAVGAAARRLPLSRLTAFSPFSSAKSCESSESRCRRSRDFLACRSPCPRSRSGATC
jgi:hypothetical protein